METLECHSKGDKRYSAFYAKVSVFGKEDSIENHYQLSKRFYGEEIPKSWKDIKGKNFDFFQVNTRLYPKEYITYFYKLLWIKYFDKNPDLLSYASTFDNFNDIFKSKKSMVCQADVIEEIVKKGRQSVMEECKDFLTLLIDTNKVLVLEKDLTCTDQDIIGHQVNCQGVMGTGVALDIRNKYRQAYLNYNNLCISEGKSDKLLGMCQLVSVEENKYVANIFGQYFYGRKQRHTDYDNLKKGLMELKEKAIELNLSVALPYKIGCNNAGGDWNIVENIISEVFFDYPIILHKK